MITVTLSNKRHIAAVHAAYLASIPAEGDAPYASPQAYAQSMFEDVAESWAESTNVDRISVAEFVMRFPGAAMDDCKAREPNDHVIAAILTELRTVKTVRLGHPTTVNGVAYLVSAGVLTQAQADVALSYDIPQVPAA